MTPEIAAARVADWLASNDNPTPEEAYVRERVERCCEILARPLPPPPPLEVRWPRRWRPPHEREITATSFVGWAPPQQRISYRVLGPLPATSNGLPAMPLDNWSADPAAFRDWERHLDELLDDQQGWLEAAE